MSALEQRFRAQTGRGFVPFIVAGDPDLKTSAELISALSELKPAAIELGVPFSDPIADGPVIQRSGQRSLRRGVTLDNIFALLQKTNDAARAPIILFGYYNPILQFGIDRFVRAAARAGVAGVLVVDLPAETAAPLQKALRACAIDLIFLVAPTTSARRLKLIAEMASGFIYAVARTGVTGSGRGLADESAELARRIRAASDLPVAVGFGITDGAQARRVRRFADAAVVGSRLVSEIETLTAQNKFKRAELVRRVVRCARHFVED